MPPSIISLLSHPKGMLKEEFQRYKSVFKNYLSVTYHAARGIYPVKGVIRSTGNVVTFNSYDQMCLFVHGIKDVSYDVGTGRLTFTSKYGRKIVFIKEEGKNDEINGSICDEFGDEIYDFCDVNGRYVVDVGANVGASAIYFATRGAKKVLAFEPFPYS
jgi:hypothetical protein